jgi:hypothetical protein
MRNPTESHKTRCPFCENPSRTPPEPIKNRAGAESILTDTTSSPKQIDHAKAFIATDDKRIAAGKAAKAGGNAGGLGGPAEQAAQSETPVNGVRPKYLASLPNSSIVQEIGEGRYTPTTSMLRGKDGQKLQSQVATAYPDYNWSKAEGYNKLQINYSSGKESQQIEAGNTTMIHAAAYAKVAADPLASIPQTPANKQLNAVAQQLGEELNSAYTPGVMEKDKRAAIMSNLTSLTPSLRQAGIKEYMGLLGDKINQKQQTWGRAKPSTAIKDYPLLSPDAQAAYQQVTGQSIDQYGKIGSGSNSSMSPNPNAPQLQNGQQVQHSVPAGATPGRNAAGQIIGYRLPNGQTVRF